MQENQLNNSGNMTGSGSEQSMRAQPQSNYEPPKMLEPHKMRFNKNFIIIAIAVVVVILTGVLIFINSSSGGVFSFLSSVSKQEAVDNAIDYLNNNLLQGQKATASDISDESGVIKFKVNIDANSYDSYVTKDGRLFFPQAYTLSQPSANNSGNLPGENISFDITSDNHIKGNINAPVTLVEFSDFECPFCVRHVPTIERILSEYKDSVRLVYKHYPLSGIHPNAQKAAEASECASDQGKFWEYHDKLFANQPTGLSVQKFKTWAVELGLNATQFNNCLDSSKYEKKVKDDLTEGSAKGVDGTPATFVNGEIVSGAVPFETFKEKIDKILNK